MIHANQSKRRSYDPALQRHRAAQQQQAKTAKLPRGRSGPAAAPETAPHAPRARRALQVQASVTATVLTAMCLGAQGAAAAMQASSAPALTPALAPRLAPAAAPAPRFALTATPPAVPASVSLGDAAGSVSLGGNDCISLSGGACPPSFFEGGSAAFAQGVNADGRNVTVIMASTAPGLCDDLQANAARASSRRLTLRLFNHLAPDLTQVAQAGTYNVTLPSVSANFTQVDPTGRAAEIDIKDFDGTCTESTAGYIVPQNKTGGTLTLQSINATTARIQVDIPHSPDVSAVGSTQVTGALTAAHCPALGKALAADHYNATTLGWEGAPEPQDCIA